MTALNIITESKRVVSRPALAALALCFPTASLLAVDLHLTTPLDLQVIQRNSKTTGIIPVRGRIDAPENIDRIEARLTVGGTAGEWGPLPTEFASGRFTALLEAPAGGWHRLELRAISKGEPVAEVEVKRVGIGEVFVVAGQSNSANHGEEKQAAKTGKVTNFDGSRWRIADDPQPGASGGGGSFVAPLGDALAEKFGVPIGFVTCGIGATSVREWLPEGDSFPNPPTIEANVRQLPGGDWESNGAAFRRFTGRIKPLGPNGFRAVLWHQGESDANQKDATRTLPGKLYREYLERVITESNKELGWDAPWFVAQVSYHVPGDESSPDIRAAQASLWKDGIALEGPDSDALKGALRERDGKGVHFSGAGLREHAARWAEKVSPWLERHLERSP